MFFVIFLHFLRFFSGTYGACFYLKLFTPTSKTLNFMGKIAGAVGMA